MANFLEKLLIATIIAVLILAALVLGAQFAKAEDMALGDSIALGTGKALGVETSAVEGIGSCTILGLAPVRHFRHVVVSAGINDPPGSCVEAIRNKLHADHITWIVPAPINSAYNHVVNVAAAHGDRIVTYLCKGGCTSSNFHPASYLTVAHQVRAIWNEQP